MRNIGRHDNQRGFSMLEMVLVISIMGIMSFMAIPAITNTQTVSLDSAIRKVEGDIRYAQSLATTTGLAHGFRTTNVGGTNETYEIYQVSNNQVVTSPYDHQAMQEDFAESFSGITFSSSHEVRFDSLGKPTVVSGGTNITVQNVSSETKDIVIGNAGFISIQ